jgi:hypothetical protein
VVVSAISASAKTKIEAKGGTVELIVVKPRTPQSLKKIRLTNVRSISTTHSQLLQDSGAEIPDFVHILLLAVARFWDSFHSRH